MCGCVRCWAAHVSNPLLSRVSSTFSASSIGGLFWEFLTLVCVEGSLACFFSYRSGWREPTFFSISSVSEALSVRVRSGEEQWAGVATFCCCCQPAVTCSGGKRSRSLSRDLTCSLLFFCWLWRALFVPCTRGCITVLLKVSLLPLSDAFFSGAVVLWICF